MKEDLLKELLELVLTNQLFIMNNLAGEMDSRVGCWCVGVDILRKQIDKTNEKLKDINIRW